MPIVHVSTKKEIEIQQNTIIKNFNEIAVKSVAGHFCQFDKKFTIFNYNISISIKITSCVNFGTLFRKKNIDDVRAIFWTSKVWNREEGKIV